MKKIIRLTESDLTRIVRRVLKESNLMLENRMFIEKSRQYLMEGSEKDINPQLVNNYVKAVQDAMPDYSNAEGFKDSSQNNGRNTTIFGQLFYNLPLILPDHKDRVLSNLSRIQGIVRGMDPSTRKAIPGKERQFSCIPKVLTAGHTFSENDFCKPFEGPNKQNFQKYAAMNAAYNNLYNSINNIQK